NRHSLPRPDQRYPRAARGTLRHRQDQIGMAEALGIGFRWLEHGRGLPVPRQQTGGAAGLDLPAALAPGQTLEIAPGSRAIVPTGLCIALPPGHEGQVRPRSGLAARHGVTVLNSPGTIDADYRGEVMVIL